MQVNLNKLISKNGKLYLKSNGSLFEGNIIGKLSVKVIKGLFQGKCKTYYDNGELKEEYSYISSKIEGKFKSYYKLGHLNWEGNYTKNKRNGKWVQLSEKGKIYKISYFVNDKEDGEWLAYSHSPSSLSFTK